jgi:hypothetical protein
MNSPIIDRFAGAVRADGTKEPCDAATLGIVTLSGYQTIDGVNLNTDYMRVLVKNQTDQTTNGIYYVFDSAWIRAADFDGPSGTVCGQLIVVTGGSQAGIWQLTTPNPVQIDQSGGQTTSPSHITFQPGVSIGSLGVDLGFSNFILSPVGDQTPPGSGLTVTLQDVTGVVNNLKQTYHIGTVTLPNTSIIDYWGNPDGTISEFILYTINALS